MCLQKSYNNGRWDFIPWEEASPALCCPLCIYWSSLLFLHSLIPCKWLDVWDYFRRLIVIENLRQIKDYLESEAPCTPPYSVHHLMNLICRKPFLLEERTLSSKYSQGASRAILAEQRRNSRKVIDSKFEPCSPLTWKYGYICTHIYFQE